MRFFTSDLHHKHKNIVQFTNRGKETAVDSHDDWLVNLWNSQVKYNDDVWHLGDLSFAASYAAVEEFVSKLNGSIYVILGNHDKKEHFVRLKNNNLIKDFFDYKEIKAEETKVCLFHYAVTSWNKQGCGSWMLHGHSHGSLVDQGGKILDVGLDSSFNLYGKHRLFSESDVKEYMQSRETSCFDHHKVY